jgi:hypothetical protein
MNPKYAAKPRKCEDKAFLYEQYWGELKSVRSIANMDCVEVAKRKVKEQMRSFGIPIRGSRYRPDNAVPPYSCFYGEGESTTDTGDSKRFDPDYEKEDKTFEWNGKEY